MLKWVLGMANGMWVLLQHPRTHVFGIPSSSFPIRPSSSSLQTIKPPQQQQNPLPTIPHKTKRKRQQYHHHYQQQQQQQQRFLVLELLSSPQPTNSKAPKTQHRSGSSSHHQFSEFSFSKFGPTATSFQLFLFHPQKSKQLSKDNCTQEDRNQI